MSSSQPFWVFNYRRIANDLHVAKPQKFIWLTEEVGEQAVAVWKKELAGGNEAHTLYRMAGSEFD